VSGSVGPGGGQSVISCERPDTSLILKNSLPYTFRMAYSCSVCELFYAF